MKIDKFEFDKVYETEIDTEEFKFGDIDRESLIALFRDGRIAAYFFERQIPYWFPQLTFVDQAGYDHVDEEGNKYDAKGFTKNGCKFMPSNQIGAGRKFNAEVAHQHANEIAYIIHDITTFPSVKVIFKTGSSLLKDFPNCSITYAKKGLLFNGQ
jgi:hypothetical protein